MSPLDTPMTVPVRIVMGVFVPCRSCHWFTDCVVPKGKHFPKSESFAIRPIYQCEDYVPNMPTK